MKTIIITIFALQLIIPVNSENQKKKKNSHTIKTVTIGDQIWMCKNLDVDHYRNGDSIPHITDPSKWRNTGTGAWCYYNNDSTLGKLYGKLYNFYAVIDPRGLAPEGWHIPSDEEWTTLSNVLGGESIAGAKLMETGNKHWVSNNDSATNETKFTGLPAGARSWDGKFQSLGTSCVFRTSTQRDGATAWIRYFGITSLVRHYYDKEYGFSVRCVKD